MKENEAYDDLIDLFRSKTESIKIKSINLNEIELTAYRDRILIDVFESNHKANRMQVAVEKKDVLKLIEFLNNNK